MADAFIQLYSVYTLSVYAFPGNRTHDLGVASFMLYCLSYRNANKIKMTKKTMEGKVHVNRNSAKERVASQIQPQTQVFFKQASVH